MDATASIARLLTPPLCICCAAPCEAEAVLCAACTAGLGSSGPLLGSPPEGIELAFSAARHDAVARDLVKALKFGRIRTAADLIAERIAERAPPGALAGTLVAVPAASLRLRWRGFDPAAEISLALSRRTGLPVSECLHRRGLRRQLGQARRERLARPPRVEARSGGPPLAVLVDDVLTTGATLSSCARTLRSAGTRSVRAVTFTRRL